MIVGLPESHVLDIEIKNVDIQATKGFQIGYADVKTDGFKVTTTDGEQADHAGAGWRGDGEVMFPHDRRDEAAPIMEHPRPSLDECVV